MRGYLLGTSAIYMRAHHFFVRDQALLPAILNSVTKCIPMRVFAVSSFARFGSLFCLFWLILIQIFPSDARCEVPVGRSKIGTLYCCLLWPVFRLWVKFLSVPELLMPLKHSLSIGVMRYRTSTTTMSSTGRSPRCLREWRRRKNRWATLNAARARIARFLKC